MTSAEFESLRLYLVAVTILFRLVLMPRYLQAYLNLAYDKVNMLRQEAGKISNGDLQRIVIRVFYYLCVVTLQYVAPMILILYLSFLYKTLGGGSWIGQPSTTPSAVTNSSMSGVGGTEEFPEAVADDNEVTLESLLPALEQLEARLHNRGVPRPAWLLHLVVLLRLVRLGCHRHRLSELLCRESLKSFSC